MTIEPTPTATPDGADPSMEEILASIRRILNDDDAPAAPAEHAAEAPADDDVLILDQSMMVSATEPMPAGIHVEPAAPADAHVEPAAPVAHSHPAAVDPEPEPVAPPAKATLPEPEATPPPRQADPKEPAAPILDLVAPEAAALAASSVGHLVRTLAAGRAVQVYAGGPTLEDMVRAELRPLLKEWLDSYLPPMVERLVRVEIERVVGRGIP